MTVFPINVIVNPAGAVAGSRRVKSALGGVQKKASTLQKTLNNVFKFAGLTLGLSQLAKFADAFIVLQNRLRIAGFETDQLAAASKRLIAISVATRSPLDANARLLGRIGIASQDLGASQEDMFRVIELVGKGLAIQGASAQEARGALTQLAQALGSGIVRAEEFNSISEGALPILQAVSAAMGTTVSGLRKLVIAGKVTSKEFFQALLDGGAQLDELFRNVTPTIGQAFTVLETKFIELTGTLEQNFGILSAVARAILLLSTNLALVVPIIIDLGIAFATVKLINFSTAIFGLLVGVTSLSGVLNVLGAAFPRTANAVTKLSLALKFLAANPIFLVIAAIGIVITLLFQFGDSIKLAGSDTITLNLILQGLVIEFNNVFGGVNSLIAAMAALLIVFGVAQLFGFRTVLGTIAVGLVSVTVRTIAWAAALLLLNPTITVLAILAASLIALGFAIAGAREEIEEMFPITKVFFEFMSDALDKIKAAWVALKKVIKDVATALGKTAIAAQEVAEDLDAAGDAGAGMGTDIKKGAEKALPPLKELSLAADFMAFKFADASNSASNSLNTLASNAASVANSIKASMAGAASAVAAAGGDGRGNVGTGTGTSINTGGSKTITISTQTKAEKAFASAVGGKLKSITTGGSGGRFRIANVILRGEQEGRPSTSNPQGAGGPFTDAARIALSRQAALTLGTTQVPKEVTELIQELGRVQGALKRADNLAAAGFNINASSGATPGSTSAKVGAISPFGGAENNQTQIVDLALREQRLQKQLEALLKPPAEALESAAVSLEVASANLSDIANAPIFLTGNPFEAFKQNVFGFAKGGTFEVPGSGGADSKLVQLALTPGEVVDIKTKAQQKDDKVETVVVQNVTFNIETPDVNSFRRSQSQIVGKTINTLASVGRRM